MRERPEGGEPVETTRAGGAICPPRAVSGGAAAWRSSPIWQATLVFALAFLLRALFLAEMAPHPLLDINLVPGTDMEAYLQWGRRLAAGNWLGRGEGPFWQGPAFPYLLGLCFRLWGPGLYPALVGQALLGSVTAVLVYAAGRLLFSPAVGLLAGILAAGSGMLICFGVVLHSTTLEVLLAAAALCLLALAGRRGGRAWLWAGVGLGCFALARPNGLLAPPFILAGLWAAGWGRGRAAALGRSSLLFLLGFALVILPVTARNLLVGGRLVLVTAAGPETFRITNSYDSTPLNFRYPTKPRMPLDSWPFWRHQLRKAGYFWWGFEVPQNVNYYLFRSVSRLLSLPLVAFWAMAPLAAAGLWLARREWRRLAPIFGFGLAYYLSVVAFHIVGRFRLPLLPLLLLLAAHALATGFRLARERAWGPLAAGGALTAACMLVAYPWGMPTIYPVDHGNYGYILANRGELAAGLRELEIAERGLPDQPRLNYDIARILLILHRPLEALPRFEREIRAAPANPNPYWRAGQAARQAGARARALGHLEGYLALAPDGPQADAVRREIAALREDPSHLDGGKKP